MSPADLEISGARRDGMGKQTTNGIAVSIPFKILADKPKMKGWSKMKQGLTLTDLAREIERQQETKRDLIADTRKVEVVADDEKLPPMMRIGDNDPIGIRDSAHVQIAGRVGIPVKYYRRMQNEAPHLLARNVNHWFQTKPERRMIRTLDGEARAVLSDRYRVLDNIEVLQAVLPMLTSLNVKVQSSAVTESRLYVKATFPSVQAEVKVGDIVEAGFSLANSEIGLGSLSVSPMVNRLVCLNGAMFNDMGIKKYHVGRQNGSEGVTEFLKDDTLRADDQAFLLKIRDAVTAAADEAFFGQMVERMKASTERKIEQGKTAEVIEVVQKKFSLLDSETAIALEHLQAAGDLSQYGLGNAVTRMSQDVESYDRATELERLGGRIFEMGGGDWRQIALAA
jgi:hypothetical protein